MGVTTARMLSSLVAGLLALGVGSGGILFAADSPAQSVPGEPSVVERAVDKALEKTVDKLAVKIGETIDETIGEETAAKIDDAHEDQERFFGKLFERVDRIFGEQYVEDRERKVQFRAGLETTFNDDGTSINTEVNLGLRLPLPALKRRINIFLDIGGDVNELGDVSSPKFSESEKNFSLGASVLRRFRENMEAGFKLKVLSAGAVFSMFPFVRFERQRASTRYFFEERIIWESDNSWNSRTALDLDYRFRSGLFLRQSNRIDYPFEEPGAYFATA